MTDKETLDWMFAQLPMYQREGKVAFKKDLTNIFAFSKELKSEVLSVSGILKRIIALVPDREYVQETSLKSAL